MLLSILLLKSALTLDKGTEREIPMGIPSGQSADIF